MRNKTIFRVAVCIIILSTFILPVSAQQPDKTNEYEVSLKKLMEVTVVSEKIKVDNMIIHTATLKIVLFLMISFLNSSLYLLHR